jgi:hypothetical protein
MTRTQLWLTILASVVGMCTGITGTVVALISYRRVSRMKALDLRLELRKAFADADRDLQALPDAINTGNRSRQAVQAAMGTGRSGAMELWYKQVAQDLTAVGEWAAALALLDGDYATFTTARLESTLVDVYRIRGNAEQTAARYRAALADDDRNRDHIREEIRARRL